MTKKGPIWFNGAKFQWDEKSGDYIREVRGYGRPRKLKYQDERQKYFKGCNRDKNALILPYAKGYIKVRYAGAKGYGGKTQGAKGYGGQTVGVKGFGGAPSIWYRGYEYPWDAKLGEYARWVRKGNAPATPYTLKEQLAKDGKKAEEIEDFIKNYVATQGKEPSDKGKKKTKSAAKGKAPKEDKKKIEDERSFSSSVKKEEEGYLHSLSYKGIALANAANDDELKKFVESLPSENALKKARNDIEDFLLAAQAKWRKANQGTLSESVYNKAFETVKKATSAIYNDVSAVFQNERLRRQNGGKPRVIEETKKKTKRQTESYKPDLSYFPSNVSDVKVVSNDLGGSTGALLVSDANGNNYIMKRGNSPEHIVNEGFADAFYQAAGVKVPAFKMYDDNGTPVKLSTQLKNVTGLDDWWENASEEQREEMRGKIRKDVAVDILMGNWDFIGDWDKNILIDEEGTPWRIDNGCSMGFRGQGGKKDRSSWGEMFDDLFTMTGNSESIGSNIESTIPTWLGTMRPLDIAREINSRDWSTALDTLNPENRAVVEKRLEEARQLAERGEENEKFGRTKESTDKVLAYSYQMCKDGLREALPKKIDLNADNLTDWEYEVGWLREGSGETRILDGKEYESLNRYLYDKMGEKRFRFICAANDAQGGCSYNEDSILRKLCVLKAQGFDCTDPKYKNFEEFAQEAENAGFYCTLNQSQSSTNRRRYEDCFNRYHTNPDQFEDDYEAVNQYDAAIQLILENIELENVDPKTRTAVLGRTEDSGIVQNEQGQNPRPGERSLHRTGACESHSRVLYVGINESDKNKKDTTVVRVPFSRIHGLWIIEGNDIHINGQYSPQDASQFCEDEENEIIADTHGLPIIYAGVFDNAAPEASNYRKCFDDWETDNSKERVTGVN